MLRIRYIVFALVLSNAITCYFTANYNRKEDAHFSKVPEQISIVPKHQTVDSHENFSDAQLEKFSEIQVTVNGTYNLAYVGDCILNMKPSNIRKSLLQVLVAGWFEVDSAGLAEWINQQPKDANVDQAVYTFSRLSSVFDPEISLEWAASICDSKVREQAVSQVAKQFRSVDPNSFHQYMSAGGSISRLIASTGIASIPDPNGSDLAGRDIFRFDIIEEESESNESILARRTRLADSSSRRNAVEINKDSL